MTTAIAPTLHDGATLASPANHARVTIARRVGGRWHEHSVPAADLSYAVRHLAGRADVYLSWNCFRTRRRTVGFRCVERGAVSG